MQNNHFGIDNVSYQILLDTLAKFKDQLSAVIIFGSRAKGNYKNGSDIDLAFKTATFQPNYTLQAKLSNLLNEEVSIPHHVDIIDYFALTNPNLKAHIDRVGTPII